MRFLILPFLFLLAAQGFAQNISDTILSLQPNSVYQLTPAKASGMVVKHPGPFEGVLTIASGDTIEVTRDPHMEASVVMTFPESTEHVSFYSGNLSGVIQLVFLHAEVLDAEKRSGNKLSADPCEVNIIPPSTWRSGLEEPKGTPAYTETTHLIIHHSAGSNNISDPYQVVRNIYIYHTQSNGWDDIGYNYLIAPDGTIFQGRDSKGLFDPDYVRGAHMCGNNTNTMGICMLGTFSSVSPTHNAMESLYSLIAWKAEKDDISLLSQSYHSSAAKTMHHVSGHRDGCAPGYTECPGNQLYNMLPTVRTESEETREECEDGGNIVTTPEEQILVYPNPTGHSLKASFDWYYVIIYDIASRRVGEGACPPDQTVNMSKLKPGMYILRFITHQGKYNLKVLKE